MFLYLVHCLFSIQMKRLINLNAWVPFLSLSFSVFFKLCCSSLKQIELEWAKSHNWLYYLGARSRKKRSERENKECQGEGVTESKWGEEFARLHTPPLPPVMSHTDSGSTGVRLQLVFTLRLSFYENHVLNIITLQGCKLFHWSNCASVGSE